MITIKFFAQLREEVGVDKIEMDIVEATTIDDVRQILIEKGEHWRSAFQDRQLLCALNHTVVGLQAMVNTGDELAFFPPVTGG